MERMGHRPHSPDICLVVRPLSQPTGPRPYRGLGGFTLLCPKYGSNIGVLDCAVDLAVEVQSLGITHKHMATSLCRSGLYGLRRGTFRHGLTCRSGGRCCQLHDDQYVGRCFFDRQASDHRADVLSRPLCVLAFAAYVRDRQRAAKLSQRTGGCRDTAVALCRDCQLAAVCPNRSVSQKTAKHQCLTSSQAEQDAVPGDS